MSTIKVNTINDALGGSSAVLNGVVSAPNSMGFRNRIINGDHAINQRGLTSLSPFTAGTHYLTDRWAAVHNVSGRYAFTYNWASAPAPEGFPNRLTAAHIGVTTAVGASEYWSFKQHIEGLNVADLGWGTSAAKTVTLSFVVRSNQTGLMGAAIQNADATRSYPFGFTIAAANTWQTVTVTIPGDTSGTWLATNGIGISLVLNLGAGSSLVNTANAWAAGNFVGVTGQVQLATIASSNLTFTGVQFEVGTNATPFERRAYGQELALCQRYCWVGEAPSSGARYSGSAGSWNAIDVWFPVAMRAAPTVSLSGLSYSNCSSAAVSAIRDGKASIVVTTAGVATYTLSGATATATAEL